MIYVSTILDMLSIQDSSVQLVYVKEAGTGGIFLVDRASVIPADGGTVFVGITGWRFIRSDEGHLNLTWFGAVGDGITDNQRPIENFLAVWVAGKRDGFIPSGTYRMSGRWVVDLIKNPDRICPKLYGEGAYSSVFVSGYSGHLPAFEISRTTVNLDVSAFQGCLERVGFRGDTPNILASLGKDDFSDNLGNFQFNQVFWGNDNTTKAISAITLKVNWLFDCVWGNCVVVGRPQCGAALWLRKAVFCNFIGGSYSNAINGIYIVGEGCCNITFTTPDIENVNCALYVEDAASERIRLVNPYIDVWNPSDMIYPAGAYPFYVGSTQVGGVTIEDPFFARSQSFLYKYTGYGTPGAINPSTNYSNLIVKGKFAGQSTPQFLPSDIPFKNTTGQVQAVNITGAAATFINGYEIKGCSYLTVNPGDTVALRYTTTPVWRWKAAH